jgi:hypothetical protein
VDGAAPFTDASRKGAASRGGACTMWSDGLRHASSGPTPGRVSWYSRSKLPPALVAAWRDDARRLVTLLYRSMRATLGDVTAAYLAAVAARPGVGGATLGGGLPLQQVHGTGNAAVSVHLDRRDLLGSFIVWLAFGARAGSDGTAGGGSGGGSCSGSGSGGGGGSGSGSGGIGGAGRSGGSSSGGGGSSSGGSGVDGAEGGRSNTRSELEAATLPAGDEEDIATAAAAEAAAWCLAPPLPLPAPAPGATGPALAAEPPAPEGPSSAEGRLPEAWFALWDCGVLLRVQHTSHLYLRSASAYHGTPPCRLPDGRLTGCADDSSGGGGGGQPDGPVAGARERAGTAAAAAALASPGTAGLATAQGGCGPLLMGMAFVNKVDLTRQVRGELMGQRTGTGRK